MQCATELCSFSDWPAVFEWWGDQPVTEASSSPTASARWRRRHRRGVRSEEKDGAHQDISRHASRLQSSPTQTSMATLFIYLFSNLLLFLYPLNYFFLKIIQSSNVLCQMFADFAHAESGTYSACSDRLIYWLIDLFCLLLCFNFCVFYVGCQLAK